MFHIVLHEPQIAPNTGNIIRLAANTGFRLHLIEPLGFDFEERKLRRAGLDYHDLANVSRYPDFEAFLAQHPDRRIFALTTKAATSYSDVRFEAGDMLLFGSETAGLPPEIREGAAVTQALRLPMCNTSRSLNLSNAVAVVCYEAWRQHGFEGGI
ncbi:tRNA (uridine(34)/cytosine(34)/5-carboxymethylaminomethyluridine (34)-2'-O)-methyltransferase TrmL [Marinobacter nanhaiticus D15-8W]|uniref:tRNA (cytidine(34)-2'-O)-methyltransferase n=1 Tax=Marinobacter nanhaiticus D15-8W TaxID=626887 RepID=N6X589_9GAMM|nr:tRNA (cytidine(34)-2'-O)-methyltransferase [Marinobacter nanhaiticus]ENO16213.1 tRNA (cytidine(34)-2'-O)-methyltransferase [Marinobacter nanhaiticus D15-8W]BES72931.1 tRNA (uridine(34)/cytosine(34)/5-carboxymethylaminomethyluridine (34)-2'-O)-methyltransferase TrmL [Marinobacter nanhaiticus D15-8W]